MNERECDCMFITNGEKVYSHHQRLNTQVDEEQRRQREQLIIDQNETYQQSLASDRLKVENRLQHEEE